MRSTTSRRAELSDVGDDRRRFLIRAGEPFQLLLRAATHVSGAWSSRTLAPAEVRRRTGIVPSDCRCLVIAFQEEGDAQPFAPWRAASGGRA